MDLERPKAPVTRTDNDNNGTSSAEVNSSPVRNSVFKKADSFSAGGPPPIVARKPKLPDRPSYENTQSTKRPPVPRKTSIQKGAQNVDNAQNITSSEAVNIPQTVNTSAINTQSPMNNVLKEKVENEQKALPGKKLPAPPDKIEEYVEKQQVNNEIIVMYEGKQLPQTFVKDGVTYRLRVMPRLTGPPPPKPPRPDTIRNTGQYYCSSKVKFSVCHLPSD